MKLKIIQILLFILTTNILNAQTVDLATIDCKNSDNQRILKIWKPENYNSENPTQVIFVFDAEMLFNIIISNIELYSNFRMDKMPQTIVVGIYYNNLSDRTDVGYLIDSETLNSNGTDFYTYVHEDVFSYINNNYVNDFYSVYVGWSYLAQYADYIIEHDPEKYDAYLLFSPETKPNTINYSNLKNKRVYIASAGHDIKKRREYAESLEKKMKSIDGATVFYEDITNASHMDIVIRAFPKALDFLYKDYINSENIHVDLKNVMELFNENDYQNKKNYKTPLRKNANNFWKIAEMLGSELTSENLDSLCSKFKISTKDDANLLELVGGFYIDAKDYEKGIYYFKESINNYKVQENIVPNYMTNVYASLGNAYLRQNNYAMARKIFREGLEFTKMNNFNYFLGKTEMGEENNLKIAVNYFHLFIDNYDSSQDYTLDNTYFQLAIAYNKLKSVDKAIEYIDLAIGIKDTDSRYKEFKSKLFGQ